MVKVIIEKKYFVPSMKFLSMGKLKDEVMKLTTEEQFEIYNALQDKFEKPGDVQLTPEQTAFIYRY